MAELIEGRVSAIVSIREVAINRGSEHGVTEGMVFAILAESPFEITDPETEKTLGKMDRVKVRVKVSEVRRKWALARTYETQPTSSHPFNLFESIYASYPARPRTLRVEDSELPPPLAEEESFVKRGDRVRQVAGGDEEASD